MNWITIKAYTLPHEAHLDEMLLKSEGIETFLKDELTNRVDNFMSHAIGGVKLQVREHDVAKAQKILNISTEHNPQKDFKPIINFASSFAKYIPFVRKMPHEKKVFISLALLTIAVVGISSIIFLSR